MAKLAVIGAGAWGSALACIGVRGKHETVVWSRNADQVDSICRTHRNPDYLGDLVLDQEITATADLAGALDGADVVLLSVPAQSLGEVVGAFPPLEADAVLVTTCKGIDRNTMQLPAGIVRLHQPSHAVAALSGPSFAHDVVQGLPTAVTIASDSGETADRVAGLLSTASFRCYSSDDILGVELGGALKNVLALAVGAARGMQLGASAEAALVARGFAEILRLSTAMGARPETLMGLSGLGDITLTCSTPQSRNFTYGMALGKGDNLHGLKLAEGAFTASVAQRLAAEHGVSMPITDAVVDVLEQKVTAREAVSQLLTRPLRRES
jgi:glycerol-3-phosphate dehydrogenase (NAD(P)+)